jgi:hypothetical protein
MRQSDDANKGGVHGALTLNQDVKTNALGKSRPTNKAEMVAGLRSHLYRRQKQPHVIRNLFQEKHVRYAA